MENKKEKQVFEFEGKRITFDFGDGEQMVNATEMMNAFPKKRMNDFLRLKQTKEFIELAIDRYGNSRIADEQRVLRVIKGGLEQQGTWMNDRLALKFAAWLNPKFEMWIYDRILELLTTGKTELDTKTESVDVKTLEFVFQKIKDNAMEIHYLSDIIDDLKKLKK
jgi:hypothetical protein